MQVPSLRRRYLGGPGPDYRLYGSGITESDEQ
jgi:hypothetical protein